MQFIVCLSTTDSRKPTNNDSAKARPAVICMKRNLDPFNFTSLVWPDSSCHCMDGWKGEESAYTRLVKNSRCLQDSKKLITNLKRWHCNYYRQPHNSSLYSIQHGSGSNFFSKHWLTRIKPRRRVWLARLPWNPICCNRYIDNHSTLFNPSMKFHPLLLSLGLSCHFQYEACLKWGRVRQTHHTSQWLLLERQS